MKGTNVFFKTVEDGAVMTLREVEFSNEPVEVIDPEFIEKLLNIPQIESFDIEAATEPEVEAPAEPETPEAIEDVEAAAAAARAKAKTNDKNKK